MRDINTYGLCRNGVEGYSSGREGGFVGECKLRRRSGLDKGFYGFVKRFYANGHLGCVERVLHNLICIGLVASL